MYIIIDGYNLLKALYPSSLEEDIEEFLNIIEDYRKEKRCKATVIFDGHKNYSLSSRVSAYGGTKVIYTERAVSADEKIVDIVKHLGRGVIVVTSDNTLRNHAEKLGAITVSSQDFLEKITGASLEEDYDIKDVKKGNPKKSKKKERLKLKTLKKL